MKHPIKDKDYDCRILPSNMTTKKEPGANKWFLRGFSTSRYPLEECLETFDLLRPGILV
ncbi:MAG TPA: hypothetical protein VGO47_13560 [Chlamydiales bacterium]|jgi:hypothetical protein|nr:hypothetical protein [Chlamydiales bacterium]